MSREELRRLPMNPLIGAATESKFLSRLEHEDVGVPSTQMACPKPAPTTHTSLAQQFAHPPLFSSSTQQPSSTISTCTSVSTSIESTRILNTASSSSNKRKRSAPAWLNAGDYFTTTEDVPQEVLNERISKSAASLAHPEPTRPVKSVGVDGNMYTCYFCGDRGWVTCCDTCPRVFHRDCLIKGVKGDQGGTFFHPRTIVPIDDSHPQWRCPFCLSRELDLPTTQEEALRTLPAKKRSRGRPPKGSILRDSSGKYFLSGVPSCGMANGRPVESFIPPEFPENWTIHFTPQRTTKQANKPPVWNVVYLDPHGNRYSTMNSVLLATQKDERSPVRRSDPESDSSSNACIHRVPEFPVLSQLVKDHHFLRCPPPTQRPFFRSEAKEPGCTRDPIFHELIVCVRRSKPDEPFGVQLASIVGDPDLVERQKFKLGDGVYVDAIDRSDGVLRTGDKVVAVLKPGNDKDSSEPVGQWLERFDIDDVSDIALNATTHWWVKVQRPTHLRTASVPAHFQAVLRHYLGGILEALMKRDRQRMFAAPVGPDIIDYHKVISNPMDFATMQSRLRCDQYTTIELFQRDLFLLCDNATKYNAPDSPFHHTAQVLRIIAKHLLQSLKIFLHEFFPDIVPLSHSTCPNPASSTSEDHLLLAPLPSTPHVTESGFVRTLGNEGAYYMSIAMKRAATAAKARLEQVNVGDALFELRQVGAEIFEQSPTILEEHILKEVLPTMAKRRIEDSVAKRTESCARSTPLEDTKKSSEFASISKDSPGTPLSPTPNLKAKSTTPTLACKALELRGTSVAQCTLDQVLSRTKRFLRLRPSKIQGLGLFTVEDIRAGAVVTEYVGERIRNQVADKRELLYQKEGIQDYQFRVSEDTVVDATMRGSIARFINHSCDPNCNVSIKTTPEDGHLHLIVVAEKNIQAGSEITYDYKFPIEDVKIPCLCGSDKCRLFLN